MTNRILTASLICAASLVVACGHDAGTYSILASGQSFQQNSATADTKVDVLWVIDNSGSMQSSQENLTQNFPAFIRQFREKGFDFQLAVTTTQAYLAGPLFNTYYGNTPKPVYFDGLAQQEIARFRDGIAASGTSPARHSGQFTLTPKTPNLEDAFLINAMQGIEGHPDERSLQSMQAALSSSLNTGFVRSGSFLAVIILTDEDDFSNESTKRYETYDKPLIPVDDFVKYLDTLTGTSGASRRYNVSSISVPDQVCLNKIYNGAQKIGIRVGEIAQKTGGVQANICNDFGGELEVISKQIVKLASQFYLGDSKPIASTLKIVVNGTSWPRLDSNPSGDGGWSYDESANSILFHGEKYVPPQGAKIQVYFDPVSVTF